MAESKPYTLTAEDILRRNALNEQRNPRKEIPKEATQELNPLYRADPFTGIPVQIKHYQTNGDGKTIEAKLDESLFNEYMTGKYYSIVNPKINPGLSEYEAMNATPFIQYQLTLARQEVRDGKKTELKYIFERNAIIQLVTKMYEAGLPLQVLSSPEGLDAALKEIQAREFREMKPQDENYSNYFNLIKNPIFEKKLKIDPINQEFILNDFSKIEKPRIN